MKKTFRLHKLYWLCLACCCAGVAPARTIHRSFVNGYPSEVVNAMGAGAVKARENGPKVNASNVSTYNRQNGKVVRKVVYPKFDWSKAESPCGGVNVLKLTEMSSRPTPAPLSKRIGDFRKQKFNGKRELRYSLIRIDLRTMPVVFKTFSDQRGFDAISTATVKSHKACVAVNVRSKSTRSNAVKYDRLPFPLKSAKSLNVDFDVALKNGQDETMSSSAGASVRGRLAFGVSQDGQYLYILAVDGEKPGEGWGASSEDEQFALHVAGAWNAIDLGCKDDFELHLLDNAGREVFSR